MTYRSALACSCPEDFPLSSKMWRIVSGGFLAVNSMTLSLAVNASDQSATERFWLNTILLAMMTAVVLLQGPVLFQRSIRSLMARRVTLELLFLLAAGGAFISSMLSLARGSGPVYFETVAVVLVIYSVGQHLGVYAGSKFIRFAVERDASLQWVDRIEPSGAVAMIRAGEIAVGDTVRVHPGRLIPVDGTITAGTALVYAAEMTGEPGLNCCTPGDIVAAGSAVLDSTIDVKALVAGGMSGVDQLANTLSEYDGTLRLSRDAHPALKWFIPTVALIAASTFAIWAYISTVDTALLYSMSVLLVACPCGLGLAVPLTTWAAIHRLRIMGFVCRDPAAISRLAAVDTVLFDKTGTLTRIAQRRVVGERLFPTVDSKGLRSLVDAVERCSDHPFAQALRSWSNEARGTASMRVLSMTILPGVGLAARVADATGTAYEVCIGSARMLARNCDPPSDGVAVTVDGRLAALLTIADEPVEGATATLRSLAGMGLTTCLVTGDGPERAERMGVANCFHSQTPLQKVGIVDRFRRSGHRVLFVGDGLNDTAALLASDVSVAMKEGSVAAAAVADIICSGSGIASIPDAIHACRQANRRAGMTVTIALCYNMVGIAVAAFGLLHPVFAAILMACSSLFAIFSSSLVLSDEPTTVGDNGRKTGLA